MRLVGLVISASVLFAEGRRTDGLNTLSVETADAVKSKHHCRRRRCQPGDIQNAPPAPPPPYDPMKEPRDCDRNVPPQHLAPAIMTQHQGLHYVGQGANACVYLSDEPPRAIKVSKWPSKPSLWSPRAECEKTQTLHTAACGTAELQADAETYLPTCTDGHVASGPMDDTYLTMHRAGGEKPTSILRLGQGPANLLPAEYQKVVFAQMVAGLRLIHKLGYTHNDLHDGNIMLDLPDFLQSYPWDRQTEPPAPADASALPRLAIIDLGEMRPYEQGWVKDYKRDANSLWDRTSFLANCPDHNARWTSTRGTQQGAEAFAHCLLTEWNVDAQFLDTLWVVLRACIAEDQDQHIEELYNTNWVQQHLPAHDRRYADNCNAASLLESMSTEEEKR